MPPEPPQEKRSYTRVPTRIRGLARRCRSLDNPLLFQHGAMAAAVPAEAVKGSGLPPQLIEFLLAMNAKLDEILAMQNHERLRQDFPITVEILEISGAGVRFHSPEESFFEDDILEMVMLLGTQPLRMAGAKGRVVERSGGLYGFEFTKIRESDQEAVIQFVFQEQREQIRGARMG
ncbi:MAG: PilZ domain-containing protein [Desulfovibrionaceae bacterium]